ncbi:MAG: phosphoribosylamine--glycine ligase [Oscillospiraceae bacterium]|nr:phosphoribosylamine--glycine ligase [Oscillospiraceae bacterium]
MNILIIGGGGREHAICAALKKSPKLTKLHSAPGNGGIAQIAECYPQVSATDIDGVVELADQVTADYVFVAPDDPLVLGMVDALETAGFKTFGPRKNAAIIEGSKSFSKSLMQKYNIPTADYAEFTDFEPALNYIKTKGAYPVVIKCDGLALGKGVVIAEDYTAAETALRAMLIDAKFGASGKKVIIEEYLSGREVTVLAFCDGDTVVPMPASTDHKRAFDGDTGPNTGGMGAIAPTPYYNSEWADAAYAQIILPTVQAMKAEGRAFKGVLYFGLMLTVGANGEKLPKVIEYNCRFGDPEAQALLPLLQTDLVDIMEAVAEGKLADLEISWSNEASACVVMASGGYPASYDTGFEITGLEEISGAEVFHAGTKTAGEKFVTAGGLSTAPPRFETSGGRVLAVTAKAPTLDTALQKCYAEVGKISFEGGFWRKDIGLTAMDN